MFKRSNSHENKWNENSSRILSVDILRGLVMALMVLDHCRDFFHKYAFDYNPEDLNYTTPIVFYTRWITHFCAPVFIFLTGVSAYLYKQKNNASNKELANYLLVRGLILILLELTIVRFAWRFAIDYSTIGGLILWGIGWSMVALAGLIYLPRRVILGLSLFVIFGHNFLDAVQISGNKGLEIIWAFFHQRAYIGLTDNFGVNILYPVLPMIAIIGFGYYIGKWFTNEYNKEIRTGYLFYVGVGMTSLFVSLRFFQLFTEQYSYLLYLEVDDLEFKWTVFFKNVFAFLVDHYGDPSPWEVQENLTYSVMSFFNTTKYPMSLLYILMTIGPALIFLSLIESSKNWLTKILTVFGRVPLFFYVIHLFIIHSLAIIAAIIMNFDKIDAIIEGDWKTLSANYGFNMPTVYVVTLFVLALLYPLCLFFGRIKTKGKYKFLTFL